MSFAYAVVARVGWPGIAACVLIATSLIGAIRHRGQSGGGTPGKNAAPMIISLAALCCAALGWYAHLSEEKIKVDPVQAAREAEEIRNRLAHARMVERLRQRHLYWRQLNERFMRRGY
jgi:hypothetical protein